MSLVFNYHKDLPIGTLFKQKYLQEQVKVLKKIFQPEQKSKEWYEMRNNMLTASDWGTVLGENHYSNSNEVLKKKCGDDKFITNAAMQWGNKYEAVAVLIYEHRNNVKILEFGCLQHPFISFLGASPDGITEDGIMLEIKCPTSRKITGIPPSYYWCQVQGQLEVCELDRCDFLECSIKEYVGEKEYIEDNYDNNYLLNKYMNEKGVVAEFYKKNSKSYFYEYSPVCIINNDLDVWKENIIGKYNEDNNIIFSCFSYWYLEEVSCVPIYRNQEWFNKVKPELESFWNKVLKYRELGLDKLLSDINDEKEGKKKLKNELKGITKSDVKGKKQKMIKDFIILDDKTSSSDDDYKDEFDNKTNISLFTENDYKDEFNNKTNISLFTDDYQDEFNNKTNISLFSN